MQLQELYKHWVVEEEPIYRHGKQHLKVEDIDSVEFYHTVGGGSPDLGSDDFSTFAGCEVWSLSVTLKDGSYESKSLYDSNPVSSIARYAKSKGITIEWPEPTEPTVEDLLDKHIR